MDLQVGGESKFKVSKAGAITIGGSTGNAYDPLIKLAAWTSAGVYIGTGPNCHADFAVHGGNAVVVVGRNAAFGFASSSADADGGDVFIRRDGAANTLAQRNGVNAQTSRIYGTYTDASNNRRLALSMSTAGVAEIKPEGAGTGASGNVLHISGLPTSNPGAGILWNDNGTVKVGT